MSYIKTLKMPEVSINWSNILNNFLGIIWQLVITTLIFILITRFGKRIIAKYFLKGRVKLKKRSQTIANLSTNVFQYTTLFFYLFGVLSILGVPVGTLLASAGIFSLALGMGAQGFVSDLVNGFFILSEEQYNVGDWVKIGTETGSVVRLGIRTTCIKQTDGSLIYIPNRNILNVTNISHGGFGVDINLEISASNDLNKVEALIKETNTKLSHLEKYLSTPPALYGIISQSGPNLTYQVHLQVVSGNSIEIKNTYFSSYISAFQAAGVKFGQSNFETSKK